ncbi:hypothetical protein [Paenibacillus popilliae]|nr:hypothetical protein [Paenibacillus popilliae]
MNKKLFILSLAIASMLVASQSAFADQVTVQKNGIIVIDRSDENENVVLSKKNCDLTLIDKGSKLTINNGEVTFTVTDAGKKTDSLVYLSESNDSKNPRIIQNGGK